MDTQMDKYRATRDFGMGGMNVQRGMVIEFDGYNIALGGRPSTPLPSFKGAIKVGWVVPAAAYDETAAPARPQSAGIKVRPADTGNPNDRAASSMIATADAEEQVVSNVQEHAAGVRKANQTKSNRGTPEVESQDGVPVRTLQTQANSRGGARTTLTGSNTHQVIAEASRVQIEPGKGLTREELMARMTPEQRQIYKAEIESRSAAHFTAESEPETQALQGPETQGHVIASIAAPEGGDSMGISTKMFVGGGTETVDLSGLDNGPSEVGFIESEGMRFTTTNGPKGSKKAAPRAAPLPPVEIGPNDMDPRRVIAKSICRDFPDNYDFDASLRKRVARLRADYDDRPDVIRAVAGAETDTEMRLLLVEEFPEAFQVRAP